MGSSSSKHNVDEPSTSSSAGRRKIRSIVLSPSCLRFDDTDDAVQVADYQSKGNCPNDSSNSQIIVNEDHTKDEYFGKSKSDKSLELARKASSNDINEWGEFNISDAASRVGSSSQTLSPSNSFLSRCSFFRGKFGNSSFRLSRAPCTRLLSANSAPSSRNFSASDEENHNNTEKDHIHGSVNSQDDQIISTVNMLSDGNNHMEQRNVNLQAPENFIEMENMESRHTDRRNGVERNVRFSRTLSVGRLRDRVLRRSSFPEVTFSPLQQDREVRETGEGVLAHNGSDLALSNSFFHSTGMDSSSYNGENYDVETSRARDGRYRDLLEHRSNFLERRGRIRSQVRALQRLGSRFENLSGHERSCIISGQHRTGQCTCHITTRSSGPNDDTGARQSISRIVMLAEALFEVLDEIHQQSVVLSSRPSVSSIGSIPAPSDVVESLPVKLYSKLQQHVIEEAAQCYICLVEYEEGDTVRTLPCHHEFHRTCVDKWLKEVHRVCPLCRGDICTPELMAFEN